MQIDLVMPLDKFLTMPSEIILDRPRPVYYRLAESSLEQLLNKESLFNFLQKGALSPERISFQQNG